MASKTEIVNVPFSLSDSFDLFATAASLLKDFKILKLEKSRNYIKLQTGTILSRIVAVEATFKALGANQTQLELKASHSAPLDTWGYLPKALAPIIAAYDFAISEFKKVQTRVSDGLLCPTCGRMLMPGTKFCPDDGTPVAKNCPKCQAVNGPGAQFCVNCGTQL